MPKIAKLETCYMAGTCTGTLKTGTRYHAVPGPVCNGALPKALCGRKPSITWSEPSEERAVNCPACLRALKQRMYAGQDGLEPVLPTAGLKAYMTCPEIGALARVEVIGRAPEHDFDHLQAWSWRWLTGPCKGELATAYGRTFWKRTKRKAKQG